MRVLQLARLLYEVLIILVVVTYAIIIFADPSEHPHLTPEFVHAFDWGLIAFFAVEYLIRLWRSSPHELRFIRKNWFDLLAMLPIDAHFPLARLMRVIRLVRIIRASPMLWGLVTSKQMRMLFLFLLMILAWSSSGIYLLEVDSNPSIDSYGDALWWSVVTTTTVGYGDIWPVTQGGRMIAVFLMVTGIGMIGAFTANLAHHWMGFLPDMDGSNTAEEPLQRQLKQDAHRAIQNVENLSDAEYQRLLKVLELLRHPRD